MAIKNKTRYTILGVLSLKPSSGYDIKKFCDLTISHFWNENYGHIYPVLNQLLQEGLIYQEDQGVNDRRKIYHITEEGKSEFLMWLLAPVEYQPVRSELLLKLSFGSHMPKDNILAMLEEVKDRYIKNLKQYREMEQGYIHDSNARNHPDFLYWLAPLRYGIISTEASLRWCEETIENIRNAENKNEEME